MPKTRLSELQLAVMTILWERGEATVAEVRDALDRDLATTTVATVLSRLDKSGVVGHTAVGRQYLYHPQITQDEVRTSMVADLVGALFEGDPAALMSHLVSEADIEAADLERLRSLLTDTEKGGREDGE